MPMIILGIVFLVGWMAVSALWFMMSMMGTLMANDSGSASTEDHTTLIVAVIAGQGMTALAGVFASLAFFVRTRRRLLLCLFAILLVAGGLCQYGSIRAFFSSASASLNAEWPGCRSFALSIPSLRLCSANAAEIP